MENKAPYMIVGIFVIALIFGLTFFTIWLGRHHGDSNQLKYNIYFEGTVTGLKEGSTVLYQGVPVGTVDEISLTGKNAKRVNVIIAIDPDVVIKQDVVASLEMKGVTGNTYLQLSGGTEKSVPLVGKKRPPYAYIQAKKSSFESLMQNVPQVLERIEKIGTSVHELLNTKNLQNIQDITTNLSDFTKEISQNKNEFRSTINSINQFLKESADTMKLIRSEFKGTGSFVQKSLKSVEGLAHNVDILGKSLQKVVDENRKPLKNFTTNGLYEFSQLAVELRGLIHSLTHLTSRLEQDPMAFLFSDNQRGVSVKK